MDVLHSSVRNCCTYDDDDDDDDDDNVLFVVDTAGWVVDVDIVIVVDGTMECMI
jgi:hypothetical protein